MMSQRLDFLEQNQKSRPTIDLYKKKNPGILYVRGLKYLTLAV